MIDLLAALAGGGPVPGRHLLVTAHPDDETVSSAALLCGARDLTILQLTTGADNDEQAAVRRLEREAAFTAAGWSWMVYETKAQGRLAYTRLRHEFLFLRALLAQADVVWTHPYEAGHLDHDTAAWLVQQACLEQPHVVRMEAASYYLGPERQVFGDVWPDATVPSLAVTLSPRVLERKMAAVAAYVSQAGILRKFPTPDREVYRVAPVYDFSKPAPAPRARWDVKGYRPSTAQWRQAVAVQAAQAVAA